jgi:hypothetical protein
MTCAEGVIKTAQFAAQQTTYLWQAKTKLIARRRFDLAVMKKLSVRNILVPVDFLIPRLSRRDRTTQGLSV